MNKQNNKENAEPLINEVQGKTDANKKEAQRDQAESNSEDRQPVRDRLEPLTDIHDKSEGFRFRSVPMKFRVGAGFLVMIMLFVIAVITGVRGIEKNSEISERLAGLRSETLEASTLFGKGVQHTLAALRGYMLLGNDKFIQDRAVGWEHIDHSLKVMEGLSSDWTDLANVSRLEKVQSVVGEFKEWQKKIEDIAHKPQNLPANEILFKEAEPRAQKRIDSITELMDIEKTLEATPERKALFGYLADFRGSFGLMLSDIRGFLLLGETSFKDMYDYQFKVNERSFQDLTNEAYLFNSDQKTIFKQLQSDREAFLPLPQQMFHIKEGKQWNVANFWLANEAAPRAALMLLEIDAMNKSQRGLLQEDATLVNTNAKDLGRVLYMLLAIGIILGVSISFFIIQNLINSASEIQQASLKVNSTSNEILAASSQHESTATEQASQMTEIQATLNEAAATATQINQSVQEMVKNNQGIAKEAMEGSQYIDETERKVKAMTESNDTVGQKLRALNEKVEGIGKILTTILSVADQTNLLSLNAAIEAAKAGEQGKGFSVVAQEIRRLADQTAQSSQEISNIVNEVQVASSSAIMVMDKSAQDVQESSEVVKNLAERFGGINDKVQQSLPQIETVSSSITELASGNKQISSSVTEMNKALRLTVNAAQQLRQAAFDLTGMGQQLRGSVAQF